MSVGSATPPPGQGYFPVGQDGGVFSFGNVPFDGSIYTYGHGSAQQWFGGNIVGSAGATSGSGYWIAANDAVVCSFGSVPTYSLPGGGWNSWPASCYQTLNGVNNIVGMAATSDANGYWLWGSDGGVFAYGDAPFDGSIYTYGHGSAQQWFGGNIVGGAGATSGSGYWIAANDAVVCSFGSVPTYSLPGGGWNSWPASCYQTLNGVNNIVGMAATPDNNGYWLVGSDGGVFAFGDANYFGSLGGVSIPASIVAILPTPDGKGYWLVDADGNVFNFGDAAYLGNLTGTVLSGPITTIGGL